MKIKRPITGLVIEIDRDDDTEAYINANISNEDQKNTVLGAMVQFLLNNDLVQDFIDITREELIGVYTEAVNEHPDFTLKLSEEESEMLTQIMDTLVEEDGEEDQDGYMA